MIIVHTSIFDPSSNYVASICKSSSDARRESALIKRTEAPELGVSTERLTLLEARRFFSIRSQDRALVIVALIPYSTPKMRAYLGGVLERIASYRSTGAHLRALEDSAYTPRSIIVNY